MKQRTTCGRVLLVGMLITALWVPGLPADADNAPEKFEAVLGPFSIEDNPCTGESDLTLTAYVDVTFHLFTDQAGNDHFISMWNGTAVTSDGFIGPIHFQNIGQPDSKHFAFRATARVTDGTDTYVIVGTNNGFIVEKCLGAPSSEELVFAVAYTDMDVSDGTYNPFVDRLIAKLVDSNQDGVPSAGDLVITGEYPKDFEGATFGQFTVQEHIVTNVVFRSADLCWVKSDSGDIVWRHEDTFLEGYSEGDPFSSITDGFETAADDHIRLNAGSPSQPADEFSITGFDSTDQTFIDIELDCQ